LIALLLLAGTTLLIWRPAQLEFAVATLLIAALPEEWFFRAYLMSRIGTGWGANCAASVLFSLLHGLTLGPGIALQVFVPSLCFGWCYQRTGNLVLVVLLHAFANLMFVLFFARWF
ncbi:MAG: CPBP family glutamic-type intramembrane protease, partial [Gammaproteobacteria bacterium]